MSKAAVKLLAEGLAVGESTEFGACPFCLAEHEQKFHVTRVDTGLLYNCFRAKCGAAGFVGTGYWTPEQGEDRKVSRPQRKPYIKPLHSLLPRDWDFFEETWQFQPLQFMYTDDDEYALPILDPLGYRKGFIIRQPRWKGRTCHRYGVPGKAKALTYKDEVDFSKLSWGLSSRVTNPKAPGLYTNVSRVCLVEDILSAWKISQATDWTGVALNGADLGYKEVKEICQTRPIDVAIWLDPDATNQAYRIQSKWGLSFNDCRVLVSDADPKDIQNLKEVLC